ncbi:MAG TPA: hypothetical protein VF516_17950 [Kofleriaceae bacterium]
MITTTRLALVATLALSATTACGPGSSGMGGDDGGGGGDDQPPTKPLDPTGTYAVHSTFDLATNMPGTAGAVVNTIIDATNDVDDPTRWIVDQILGQLPSGTVKTLLQGAEAIGVGALNDELKKVTPDFVSTMLQVGQDFGDLAKHVGLKETLTLTQSQAAGSYSATHAVVGLHYELGNQKADLLFANYQLPNVQVDTAVTMDATGQLTIAAHDLPLTYGKLLRLGLDAAIIPMIDSSAHNLNDLLAHQIDCKAVGNAIASAIDFSSAAGTLASACSAGLSAGASVVYNKITAIDGTALKFSINGSARAVDRNNDRQIDQIQTGTWAGTLAYGTTPTPLIPATFFGERQ